MAKISKEIQLAKNVILLISARSFIDRKRCRHETLIIDICNNLAQDKCADCGETLCAVSIMVHMVEGQHY